jgi:hypothetical protein
MFRVGVWEIYSDMGDGHIRPPTSGLNTHSINLLRRRGIVVAELEDIPKDIHGIFEIQRSSR